MKSVDDKNYPLPCFGSRGSPVRIRPPRLARITQKKPGFRPPKDPGFTSLDCPDLLPGKSNKGWIGCEIAQALLTALFIAALCLSLPVPAAEPEPGHSCKAWGEWLAEIGRLSELRSGIVEAMETASDEELLALADSDIEWRARILRLMQNPPGGKP